MLQFSGQMITLSRLLGIILIFVNSVKERGVQDICEAPGYPIENVSANCYVSTA
jgi:hypothetical protein